MRFFAYASIYVILNNKYYTLAIKYTRKGETLKDTVDFLIKEIEANGFKIKTLFLDREFYTVDVINYLQNRENIFYHALCEKRTPVGGIRNLLTGKKLFYRIYYEFKG
ncbi:MAG: hypothetical protein LBB45_03550 [Methanobrevibacter sp.]|jgi:putative transposase|nr:hypothetical protein [Candidatus Methanovirga basalitermitum]